MKLRLAAVAILTLALSSRPAWGQPYKLVEGLEQFDGSAVAWQLLGSNGFVVADPEFKHFSDPYLDSSLPVYITPDSAWDAFHRLLANSLDQVRVIQGKKLGAFSRRLMTLAHDQAQIDSPEFAALSAYAAIGLALQDEDAAAALPEGQRKIVDELRSGAGTVETGLGFPLDARAFKPPNAPAVSPDLAEIFAARHWYGAVVFRLSDPRETRMALELAWLIHHDAELNAAWSELSGSDNAIFGTTTDGTVSSYLSVLKDAGPDDIAAHLDTLQSALEKIIGGSQKGFCLFPQRQLPVEPKPDDSVETIGSSLFTNASDSIFGNSLRALKELQHPAPGQMPLPCEAMQMWTALGAWAELRESWASIGTTNATSPQPGGEIDGVVAPYPKFFAGLAKISRSADVVFARAGDDQSSSTLWVDFAAVCDRLSALADKEERGESLNSGDSKWISNYGRALLEFQFENDDAGDFPIISRLDSDSAETSARYSWLAPPQALYVILSDRGHYRLHRGAVFSYRQCSRAAGAIDPTNDPPPAPDFTLSFRAEKTVADLLNDLAVEGSGRNQNEDEQATLQQLGARLTDADLPRLIQIFAESDPQPATGPSSLATLIAKMNWAPHQGALLGILETNDAMAQPVATILTQQPDALDAAWLCEHFDRQSPLGRALFCHLLGRHGPAASSPAILDKAASDADGDVRWSAVMAIRELRLNSDQSVAALTARLGDTNEYVAAAAARALGALGANNGAPILLTALQKRLAAPEASEDHWREQSEMFRRMSWLSGDPNGEDEQSAVMMHPAFPEFGNRPPAHPDAEAMVEALGRLKYEQATALLFPLVDGDCAAAAVRALDLLAPERIRQQLLATACDAQKKPEERDRALQLLLQTTPDKNAARQLEPLLDSQAEIHLMDQRGLRSREIAWRLSDRATQVIGHLLGKPPTRVMLIRSNELGPAQAREWLRDAGEK